jgi:hypothetical protein
VLRKLSHKNAGIARASVRITTELETKLGKGL